MRRSSVLFAAGLLVAVVSACTSEDADPAPPSMGSPQSSIPAVADRAGLDVWSNPNEATAIAIAPDGSVWTTGPGGTVRWGEDEGSSTVFTIDHGLASNRGNAIAVSPEGLVFVSHAVGDVDRGDGISVFDGRSWVQHTTATGLPTDSVTDLEVAADGTVWASTNDGLAYYDNGTWHLLAGTPATYNLALSPAGELRAQSDYDAIIIASRTEWQTESSEPLPGWEGLPGATSVVDEAGGWWFPWWGVGLVHSTPDGFEVHVIAEHLEEYREAAETGSIARAVLLPGLESVLGATVSGDDDVWALGGPGVLRMEGDEWRRVADEHLSAVMLCDVVADGDGGHWLATDHGLFHTDGSGGASSFALPAPVGNRTNHVAVGPAGVFASSLSRRGGEEMVTVSQFDGSAWTAVATTALARIEPSSESDHFTLNQDGYPVLFRNVSYRILNGSDWVEPNAPHERTLTRATVDGKGTLWADAGDAIWYLVDDEWHITTGRRELHVTGLTPRAEGGVWLSTWTQGVFSVDENGIDPVEAQGLTFARVTAIAAGRDGSVWVGGDIDTGTGLANWNGSNWTLVPVPRWDGAFGWITCLTVGRDGAVWIGDGSEFSAGFGGGIARFHNDTWTRYGTEAGLPSPDVYSMAVDDDGSLWVATDAGVARISELSPTTGESPPTTTTTTSTSTSTTTSSTTTTTPPPPTTTAAAYSIATHSDMPDPLPGSNGYFGSGCAPGSDKLPDGIWFGFVRDLDEAAVFLDLACLRWIPDPNDDAVEEGGWDLSNTNPTVRIVPVAEAAQSTCPWFNCPQPTMAYADWMWIIRDYLDANPEAKEWVEGHDLDVMVWLYINSGEVTEIAQPVLAG